MGDNHAELVRQYTDFLQEEVSVVSDMMEK